MEKSKKAEPSSAGLLLTLAPPPFRVCCFRAFLRRIVASKYVIDETDAVKSNEPSPEETPATALACAGPSKRIFNPPYCSRALVIYIREMCLFLFFFFFISLSFLMIEFVRWRKNANYDISRGPWPLGRELLSILRLSLCDASRSNSPTSFWRNRKSTWNGRHAFLLFSSLITRFEETFTKRWTKWKLSGIRWQ